MYAVMGTWKVPGSREEMIDGLESSVIPFIKTLPGFLSASFSYDEERGTNHSLLMFSNRESAQRFVDVSYEQRREVQQEAGVERMGEFVVVDVLKMVEAAGAPA
ncbi:MULTISPECIES: hypothetical protein [Arthrobacter]|uniref:Antibiotic biosynthesis monooxygenase n=2 Tax=Arthrobacter TaxID=1663 RepID=A0ABU9KP47_9MICC|nr:hypothetical protein [Arthrobacter sp. YJM1]MDP5228218.1 hypothetical protein [Arthrobacter sp. YJM1]